MTFKYPWYITFSEHFNFPITLHIEEFESHVKTLRQSFIWHIFFPYIAQKLVHTGCCSQWFLIVGLSFFMTTSSCMSSRVGCEPASSSNGSWYSSAGWSEQEFLLSSSHRTSPQAYMSMRKNASLRKLMAPSNISGAM